jgi:hypothetical protein
MDILEDRLVPSTMQTQPLVVHHPAKAHHGHHVNHPIRLVSGHLALTAGHGGAFVAKDLMTTVLPNLDCDGGCSNAGSGCTANTTKGFGDPWDKVINPGELAGLQAALQARLAGAAATQAPGGTM